MNLHEDTEVAGKRVRILKARKDIHMAVREGACIPVSGIVDDLGIDIIAFKEEDMKLTEWSLRCRYNTPRNAKIFAAFIHTKDLEEVMVLLNGGEAMKAKELLVKKSFSFSDKVYNG